MSCSDTYRLAVSWAPSFGKSEDGAKHLNMTSEASYTYPNPSTGEFTLRLSETVKKQAISLTVYDQLGRVVTQKGETELKQLPLDVSIGITTKGLYRVVVLSEDGKVLEAISHIVR
jgi:hypothetical protein